MPGVDQSQKFVPGVDPNQKLVQELANDWVEVPDRYIVKDTVFKEAVDVKDSLPLVDLPVIDFSRLTTEEEFEKLREAFSSWGCFHIINHGMESIVDELQKDARQFYQLPIEEKLKYAPTGDDIEGFGKDAVLVENQTLDWSDKLHLVITPEDERKMQLWPENPESFMKTVQECTVRAGRIVEILLQSTAKTLGLPENSIMSKCGDKPLVHYRVNYYPPCPRPELVLGLKQHSDGSVITIVMPDDDVEGFQLQKDNQWYRIRPWPRALQVNFGDQLQIFSNGIYKSPLHRAVANQEKERMSMALFWFPEKENGIGPIEELIDEKRPRLYKSAKNYIDIIEEAYQKTMSALEVMQI